MRTMSLAALTLLGLAAVATATSSHHEKLEMYKT